MTGQSIQQLLMEKQLLICVGAGGVGKTSMAATMGVHAAMMGRKVLVLTIDPAKRLANSLGLHEFGNEETQIDLTSLGDTKGELWAMMLDGKHAFHELIDRVAEDEATKKAIYDNNIYQSIADTIVGNQEYMATEKLYDVIHLGGYDLVILDTPPVKNALDFLESPGRMAQFVDKRIMQWFLADGKDRGMLRRLISGTSSKIFGLLGHVFGKDFLEDIAVFFQHFKELYEGFQERHQAVEALFRDPKTGFLIVFSPTEPAVEVAKFFIEQLKIRKMPLLGAIANQCHEAIPTSESSQERLREICENNSQDLAGDTSNRMMARMRSAHNRLLMLQEYEQTLVSGVQSGLTNQQRLQQVPKVKGEVHDLQALFKVGHFLMEKA
jgi:anion-transporting  ArsA/GET3 family ATPase